MSVIMRKESGAKRFPGNRIVRKVWSQKYLFLMSFPFVGLALVFNYLPIWGWLMAFQDFKVGRPFWRQKWVGLKNFVELFQSDRFYQALTNTFCMSVLNLIVLYTVPIAFAVLLNEIRSRYFKRTIQTISYLPHFVSWVVVAGIVYKMLSTDGGAVNDLLGLVGIRPIRFMAKPNLFWGIVVGTDLWKELGWNSIIYLSAITAIDPALYEAAKVDGAGRWCLIRNITLPGISNIIIILMILSIGNLMSIGFEKQMLLSNPLVNDRAQVLDLYALKYGIGMYHFSFGTAINLTNSVVAIILLFTANGLFKRRTGQSVM